MRLPCVRFTVRRMMIAVAVLGAGFTALPWLIYGPSLFDVILSGVGHDTAYSATYTEARWRRLYRGMTTSEVEAVIGPPLRKKSWPHQSEVWMYSMSPGDTHYWKRQVIFRAGKVEGFDGGFYFD
jgi:hypothetical protein